MLPRSSARSKPIARAASGGGNRSADPRQLGNWAGRDGVNRAARAATRTADANGDQDDPPPTAVDSPSFAFAADRAGDWLGAGTADPRRGDGGAQSVGAALHAAADRSAGGADRALSGSAADPGPDGGDLSAANRRSRAMAAGFEQRRSERRRAGRRAGAAALGPQRQVAGGLPADHHDAERAYRMDAGARHRLCQPAGRGHGARPGAAPSGDAVGKAQTGAAPDSAAGGAPDRHRLGGTG